MEKQFTLETRLSLDDEAKKYLNEYITFYNMISRNLWQIVRKSNFKEVYKRSDFNTYACNKYNILKRTANSIYSELLSKKNSLLELKKTEIYNCNIRYSKLSIEKDNLKEKINKLKAKVSINKATNKELIRYRKYKQKYYFLCNRINNLKQKINNLKIDIENKKVSLSFGGKKNFKAQYNLKANNYKTIIKWKNTYKKKRDKNIFYLGSKDETNGNQLAQLTYSSITDRKSVV